MKIQIVYALRGLFRDRGFAITAVLSLALGIGANSAIFTLVNSVFLSPLPVKDPSRLAAVFWIDNATRRPGISQVRLQTSYLNYLDFRDRNNVFNGLAGFVTLEATLNLTGMAPVPQTTTLVTANYFEVLGIAPALGRTFMAGEDRKPGADRIAVLSYALWQSRFGGRKNVLGETFSLNSETYTIIGVGPRGFKGTHTFAAADPVWVPVSMYSHIVAPPTNDLFFRRYRQLEMVGRLKPGVGVRQAAESMRAIAVQLGREYPWANPAASAETIPFREAVLEVPAEQITLASVSLSAVAGLVLLVACINVGSLLPVRAAGRARDVGTMISLGAGRRHLALQSLTESLALAGMGGCLGLFLGWMGSRLLWSLRPPFLEASSLEFKTDWRVCLFTAAVSLVSAVLFSLAPAFGPRPSNLSELMNSGGRGGVEGLGRNRIRATLVALQIAAAFVALSAAGLFIRGLQAAQAIDPGFDARSLLVVSFDLSSRRKSASEGREFIRSAMEAVSTVPGVRTAAAATGRPFSGGTGGRTMLSEEEEQAARPGNVGSAVAANFVTPSYFDALKIRRLQGRVLNDFDREGTADVAVINQALANHFWPGRDPLGKRFRLRDEKGRFREVVGVVADCVEWEVGGPVRPLAYFPLAQDFRPRLTLHVVTTSDPSRLLRTVLAKVQALDRDLALVRPATAEDLLMLGLWAPRLGASLFGMFGALGLGLACVGVYGLMANSVVQRTNEIGIRMALGASPQAVRSLVLRQGMILALIGIIAGAIAALVLAPLARGLLFSISPSDPATLLATAAVFALVAALACSLPAYRAARLDPASALRR